MSNVGKMEDVKLKIKGFGALDFKIQIKYADHPQAQITVQCKDIIHNYPVATLQCKISGKAPAVDFLLPIAANKFAKPSKISLNNLNQYYQEYTTSDSDIYWSLDSFIPNPAASNVPVEMVLKKCGHLFNNGLNC